MDAAEAVVEESLGRVTIAPEVLVTIARLTALSIPGVARLSRTWAGNVIRFLGRLVATERHIAGQGVKIEVEDDSVSVDLYIIAEPDVNMLELGHSIQAEVARAIDNMVGMHVREVNIHIQDVETRPGER